MGGYSGGRYQKYKEGSVLHTLQLAGISITEAAEMVGVSRVTIRNWNKKNSYPLEALYEWGFTLQYELEYEEDKDENCTELDDTEPYNMSGDK
tara:strand:- start:327 stop:605 length:279 start_codon:yes stop_codon:yes gene_type:complete